MYASFSQVVGGRDGFGDLLNVGSNRIVECEEDGGFHGEEARDMVDFDFFA